MWMKPHTHKYADSDTLSAGSTGTRTMHANSWPDPAAAAASGAVPAGKPDVIVIEDSEEEDEVKRL